MFREQRLIVPLCALLKIIIFVLHEQFAAESQAGRVSIDRMLRLGQLARLMLYSAG